MRFGVRILPKKGFLDPQGRAVESLLQKDHPVIKEVHVGKWIEVAIDEKDEAKALKQVEQIAQNVLINPLTESFELERLNS